MAQLVLDIIDNDPEAQVIAFHDSRMGIERIVQRINRPEEVLPYRSGYLAGDRRKIEADSGTTASGESSPPAPWNSASTCPI